jgi:hypothetical protein
MSKPNISPPLDREAKRRLAVIRHVEEVTGNVAMSCRYFGISRQAYYTGYRRYQAEGVEGLRTRSKAPKTCPNVTHVEVVGKIIYLRQSYRFGTGEDRHVPQAVPRRDHQQVGRLSDPQPPRQSGVCRPHSATSATTADGSGTRSNCPATASRST